MPRSSTIKQFKRQSPPKSKPHRKQPRNAGSPINSAFVQFLQMLPDNKEFVFQFLDMFPISIEVFAPDGTSVFLNRAFMELNGIKDASLAVGEYNVLKDPVLNEHMGLRDGIQRAFHGEAIVVYDVDAPTQDMVDRGLIDEKPFEKSFMDWHLFPVMDDKRLAFVVFVCIVKKLYYGRPDLARTKEYIDTHWKEEFDPQALAKSVNISVTPLYNLFKRHTGMTPGEYYRKCKIDHIKEALKDKNISVKEAFSACGENSRGAYAKLFKKFTGISPAQYRAEIEK